jgi:hypothetical protein
MEKINCWEFMKCGREPGSAKVSELGTCPASTFAKASGIHGGKDAGRCCWIVAGSLCDGKISGTYAHKIKDCLNCEFYKLIRKEESNKFLMLIKLLNKIK